VGPEIGYNGPSTLPNLSLPRNFFLFIFPPFIFDFALQAFFPGEAYYVGYKGIDSEGGGPRFQKYSFQGSDFLKFGLVFLNQFFLLLSFPLLLLFSLPLSSPWSRKGTWEAFLR